MLTATGQNEFTINAEITDTRLSVGTNKFMTLEMDLDYGHCCQTIGAHCLNGMEYILPLLEVLDVGCWEDLKGERIRVKRKNEQVYEIGHFIYDNWFNPNKEIFKNPDVKLDTLSKPELKIVPEQKTVPKSDTAILIPNDCICSHKPEIVYCVGTHKGECYVLCRKCGNMGRISNMAAEAILDWNNTEGKGKK